MSIGAPFVTALGKVFGWLTEPAEGWNKVVRALAHGEIIPIMPDIVEDTEAMARKRRQLAAERGAAAVLGAFPSGPEIARGEFAEVLRWLQHPSGAVSDAALRNNKRVIAEALRRASLPSRPGAGGA